MNKYSRWTQCETLNQYPAEFCLTAQIWPIQLAQSCAEQSSVSTAYDALTYYVLKPSTDHVTYVGSSKEYQIKSGTMYRELAQSVLSFVLHIVWVFQASHSNYTKVHSSCFLSRAYHRHRWRQLFLEHTPDKKAELKNKKISCQNNFIYRSKVSVYQYANTGWWSRRQLFQLLMYVIVRDPTKSYSISSVCNAECLEKLMRILLLTGFWTLMADP